MGCQSTLQRLVEDWRNALDNRQYAAAIMMDLSKAFDCLPHGLLIVHLPVAKINSPGVADTTSGEFTVLC